jgi:hypothetical protein
MSFIALRSRIHNASFLAIVPPALQGSRGTDMVRTRAAARGKIRALYRGGMPGLTTNRLSKTSGGPKLRECFMDTHLEEKTTFGYELRDGEIFMQGDEFAGLLVFCRGRPTKMVYPDGRVVPFTPKQISCFR